MVGGMPTTTPTKSKTETRFRWEDPLLLDQQLNDEELQNADCLLAVAVGLGLRKPGDKTV